MTGVISTSKYIIRKDLRIFIKILFQLIFYAKDAPYSDRGRAMNVLWLDIFNSLELVEFKV